MKRARDDDDVVRSVRPRNNTPTSWLVDILPAEMRCHVRSLLRRRDRYRLSRVCRALHAEDVGPHWPPNVVLRKQTKPVVLQFWQWMEMLDEAGVVDWPEFAGLELRTWSEGFQRNFAWLPPRFDITHSYQALSVWCGDRYPQPEFEITGRFAPLDMWWKCIPTPRAIALYRKWLANGY